MSQDYSSSLGELDIEYLVYRPKQPSEFGGLGKAICREVSDVGETVMLVSFYG